MVLIVYAIIIEANIVTLFMAALIPGLIAVAFFIARSRSMWRPPRARAGSRACRDASSSTPRSASCPFSSIFGVVIGGIYAGLYNPTPAAAIGVFLVAIYGFGMRRLSSRGLDRGVLETARTTGMIYLILLGAALLSIFMSRAGVPQAAARCCRTAACRRS